MSIPQPGMTVGTIRLPDGQGRPVSTWAYRQHRPLVLVLWDDADPALLAGFAHAYSAYRAAGAEVLAIGRRAPPADAPFPCLHDAEGRVAAALAHEAPAILVLDAYGELFHRWQGDAARTPDHADIQDWVRFTGLQCEECGPHAENWPRRDPGDAGG